MITVVSPKPIPVSVVGRRASTYADGTLLKALSDPPFYILRVGKNHVFDFQSNHTNKADNYTNTYIPVDAVLVVR